MAKSIFKFLRWTCFSIFMIGMIIGIFKTSNLLFTKEVIAFQNTLIKQREIANPVELTAISDRIVDINIKLEKLKTGYDYKFLRIFYHKSFKYINYVE